jgi:hypothetical protein
VSGETGVTVIVEVAVFVRSAWLFAVTTHVVFVVTEGAWNNPALLTEPAVVDQVTPVSLVLLTVALSCSVPDESTLALLGVTFTLTAGSTVTMTVANFVGSATLVAVTEAVVVVVTLGAVNIPWSVIVPFVANQVTPFRLLLVTVALKACVSSEFTVALVGLIDTLIRGVTVTRAVADLVGSATLVAVTETIKSVFTVDALNKPALEIDPLVADQVTAILSVLVTVAVNCWVWADSTLAAFGEIDILTGRVVALAGFVPTPIKAQHITTRSFKRAVWKLNLARLVRSARRRDMGDMAILK